MLCSLQGIRKLTRNNSCLNQAFVRDSLSTIYCPGVPREALQCEAGVATVLYSFQDSYCAAN